MWCYTEDKKKRWEYCNPISDDVETCKGKKCKGYRGYQTFTKTGRTCQEWAKQAPHKHSNTPEKKASKGLESNYCRNPGNSANIWCYTTDPKKRW